MDFRILVVSTSGEDSLSPYLETMKFHGAVPLVRQVGDSWKHLDVQGILLTGGGDLSEIYYDHSISKHERKTLGMIEPDREKFEFELLDWARDRKISVLGICRGCQLMNVFAGGTLIPDLPTWQKENGVEPVLSHRQKKEDACPSHDIEMSRGSLMERLMGQTKLGVNSSHHQALSALGKGLQVTARAEDGVIEAVEGIGFSFWLGVQFHPERMWRTLPIFSKIFYGFIKNTSRNPTWINSRI